MNESGPLRNKFKFLKPFADITGVHKGISIHCLNFK